MNAKLLLVFIFALVCCSIYTIGNIPVSLAFETNGTVYDVNGLPLTNANVSVLIKSQNFADLATNSSATNSSGWFNLTLNGTILDNQMYQLSVTHTNSTTNEVDYVGQSLPTFPFPEFSRLYNINYYLRDAGTINITVINSSGHSVPNNEFAYQIKDQKLGYPVQSCSNFGSNQVICYVPRNRNYSLMVYPAMNSQQHFVPVSFNWNNFSSNDSYAISTMSASNYNGTTRKLNKQFNVTESSARISGYLNASSFNITGWEEFTVVPFLLEPGNMIFMTYGILPFNASAWSGSTDIYNISLGNNTASAFYNITLPYSAAETVNYILFAAAKNGSYFGSYKNITVTADAQLNFTMYGLLGNNGTINMTGSTGGFRGVNTSRQTFQIVNATNNNSLSNLNAHIETTVDYSSYGAIQFTFMEDLSGSNYGNFSLPLLNVTGFKEMNVFSMNQAPKRVPTRTAAQITSNNNISLSAFNPGDIEGHISASNVYVSVYKSNSTCDVPSPPTGCLLSSSANMATFNPFAFVIGGGALSFRMGMTSNGIEIHYVNVDMLASGPPDGMFDAATTNSTTGGFSSAMRFGSNGPTIYDYVLVSMPYTEGNTSQTGLNESGEVNMSLPAFYDEDWNAIWNVSLNGTNSALLAGNNSHYSTYATDWSVLMQNNTCVTNTTLFNSTYPCYIDATNNKIWIRLPHFSGTGPQISGTTITATPSTSSTTTSSSSSGSSSSATTQTTNVTTKQYTSITPFSPKTIYETDLSNTNTYVTEIYVDVKERVTDITLSIGKSEKPSVIADISNFLSNPVVYRYLEVNKTNLADSNVESAYMKFKVLKNWVTTNNIDILTLSLYRYANSQWNKLTTSQTGSDNSYYYFKSTLPGFSYFAIAASTAEQTENNTVPSPPAAPEEQPAPSLGPTQGEEQKPTISGMPDLMSVGIITVIIIVVVIVVVLKFHKKIKK